MCQIHVKQGTLVASIDRLIDSLFTFQRFRDGTPAAAGGSDQEGGRADDGEDKGKIVSFLGEIRYN